MSKYIKGLYSKEDFSFIDRPAILLFGRSNVGKSSLINTIFNEKVAKTSQKPGKTVAIHVFDYNNFYLVDLPGYGYANRSKAEIAKFFSLSNDFLEYIKNKNILVLLLIDSKVSIQKTDYFAIDYLEKNNINYLFVLTKSDKANQSQLSKVRRDLLKYNCNDVVETSSLKKRGILKLQDAIIKHLR